MLSLRAFLRWGYKELGTGYLGLKENENSQSGSDGIFKQTKIQLKLIVILHKLGKNER